MRVSKDPAQRKQELVNASLALFLENGYDKTSVKDIVTKVGVAQGLYYYYFPAKEDVVKEIAEMFRQEYIGHLQSHGLSESQDALEMVQVLLKESFVYLTREQELMEGMHKPGNKYLHDIVTQAMIEALSVLVEDVLVLGNKTGALNCKYPHQLAMAFIYGIMAAIHDPDMIMMTENFQKERGFVLYFTSLVLGIDEDSMQKLLGW